MCWWVGLIPPLLLNNPCMVEGAAVIGRGSVGEDAGLKLYLGGFEQGVVQQGINREGGAIRIHEIDDFGQMRSHATSRFGGRDQQQVGDVDGHSARSTAE